MAGNHHRGGSRLFTVGEAAKRLGISAHTLRYYEKINLLPEAIRRGSNGARLYTEEDLRFIRFLLSLKETGMSLTDIAHFVQDGCLLDRTEHDKEELAASLQTRLVILLQHLKELEAQKARLTEIIALTRGKIEYYRKASEKL
jgi:DNA-binding transcriptional MerR regulator